jgi:hypothetical protein
MALARAQIGVTIPSKGTLALPFARWPDWAKDISQDRQLGDTGIGDTVVHLIGDSNSELFKGWFKVHLGTSCGCTERQRWLNLRYPYEAPTI